MLNYNAEIEEALSVLGIPFNYMFYDGNEDTYITYLQEDLEEPLAGDDEVINVVQIYDVDVYSKGNFLNIIKSVIDTMKDAGFTFYPSRCSPDMYEKDTKFYHKTLSFAKESEV